MAEHTITSHTRFRLIEQLGEAIQLRFPDLTRRHIWHPVTFPGKATAVIGMRRSGKTTFLHQIRKQKHAQGTPRQRLPFINFEDERLVGLTIHDLTVLVEEYYRRFPDFRGRETVTWCLDEIQLVPGWERWVRRLLDNENIEIFVSGSSAALLSREIATAMRGRSWEVTIFPFSFAEYVIHHRVSLPERLDLLAGTERSALEAALLDYLVAGGFPEAQGLDLATRHRLLSDYVDVAILRDVVERHRVSNVVSLRWLVRHLLANPGGLFSVEKFHAFLKSQGLAVGRDTLHQMLGYLDDCFLVRITWMQADSERRRMVNPRKIYPVDSGLIPIFDQSGKANIGHALETAVRIELERRGMDVRYVKTRDGFEVDFLARSPDSQEFLIQVCADLSSEATSLREIRALQQAAKVHPHASLHLLTLTPEAGWNVPQDITVHNAAVWFLEPWIDRLRS